MVTPYLEERKNDQNRSYTLWRLELKLLDHQYLPIIFLKILDVTENFMPSLLTCRFTKKAHLFAKSAKWFLHVNFFSFTILYNALLT